MSPGMGTPLQVSSHPSLGLSEIKGRRSREDIGAGLQQSHCLLSGSQCVVGENDVPARKRRQKTEVLVMFRSLLPEAFPIFQ